MTHKKTLLTLGLGGLALAGAFFYRNQIKDLFTQQVNNVEAILFNTGENILPTNQANMATGASGGQVLSNGVQIY